MTKKDYTIAIDFDGVIHAYAGWKGPFDFEGPVPGAIEWLKGMAKSFDIVILTTRGQFSGCDAAVRMWLEENGLPFEVAESIRVTHEKVPALVYVDDRAFRFNGTNFPTVDEIHRFRPWWKLSSQLLPGMGSDVHCDYCGSLDWTIRKFNRVTHKYACPHRAEPWSQAAPHAQTADSSEVT